MSARRCASRTTACTSRARRRIEDAVWFFLERSWTRAEARRAPLPLHGGMKDDHGRSWHEQKSKRVKVKAGQRQVMVTDYRHEAVGDCLTVRILRLCKLCYQNMQDVAAWVDRRKDQDIKTVRNVT